MERSTEYQLRQVKKGQFSRARPINKRPSLIGRLTVKRPIKTDRDIVMANCPFINWHYIRTADCYVWVQKAGIRVYGNRPEMPHHYMSGSDHSDIIILRPGKLYCTLYQNFTIIQTIQLIN